MNKTNTEPVGHVRVRRWYEGWKAVIGIVILSIMIFSAGMKFNDWVFGIYTKREAEADHRLFVIQDSLLNLRIKALETRLDTDVQTLGNVLYQLFCYQRRAQTENAERAWEVCVRPDTQVRVEQFVR